MKAVIYQILPRYWGNYKGENVRGGSLLENGCGHFDDIDGESLEYFKSLGCTHIWYTGIIRHATGCDVAGCTPSHPQIVKGNAGSPYAIYDYKDVNPYLAVNPENRMEEFKSLVRRTHDHGLKVIIDFVPNHVSRDNVNFGTDDDKYVHWRPENDFYYYPGCKLTLPLSFAPTRHFSEAYYEMPAKATGNNCFSDSPSNNDWYETVKLNYCDFHTPTWDKMLDILRFWAELGVDGFRCDMVELVPLQFFAWLIPELKKDFPNLIFIAEVYDAQRYSSYIHEACFDLLYDKSGMYDALRNIVVKNAEHSDDTPELWQSTRRLTACWQSLGYLQPCTLNFLENHDEQRISSDDFALCAENSYAALAFSSLFNTASFMLYFGQEVGEKGAYEEGFSGKDSRTSIFDWWKIESVGRLYDYIHTGSGLTTSEASVLSEYRTVMSLASAEVFSSGDTYDLCFCNMDSPGFDPDRHFAFLRYNEKERKLVVCNFSSKDSRMTIDIPLFKTSATVSVTPYHYTVLDI